MNASPFQMKDQPFVQNIVDYSHMHFKGEAIIMTTLNDWVDIAPIDIQDILDTITLFLLFLTFIFYTIDFVLFYKLLLHLKDSIGQRVSIIMLTLFGTVCGKGN